MKPELTHCLQIEPDPQSCYLKPMRLIYGAPGSGKTALVFREFGQALRDGEKDLRIVAPTATLVRHYRHELARLGFVFNPAMVVSLSRLAIESTPAAHLAPPELTRALIREALGSLSLPEFRAVAATPGLADVISETITLFENADCTPARLGKSGGLSPHGKAFLRVWERVESALAARGYSTRAQIFRAAAESAPAGRIWLDGFLKFSPVERRLVRALAARSSLTLALTNTTVTKDVYDFACELGAREDPPPGDVAPRNPETIAVHAPSPLREAEEIARRILSLNAAGHEFSSIAIAIRDVETWLPLLRTTLDRFAIPARSYFSTPLRTHPVAAFLGGLIRCAAAGWEFESTLAALRAHPSWGHSSHFDRFDFAVREAMPKRGVEGLLVCCESDRLRAHLTDCFVLEKWRGYRFRPANWSQRIQQLAESIYRLPAIPEPDDYAAFEIARSHAAALRAFAGAVDNAVEFFASPDLPVSFERFAEALELALVDAAFQVPDDRRNVVHVMSAFEARQWDVRTLVVCGMIANDYPRRRPQNQLFPDHEIERLRARGIPLLSAAEAERDEELLFESLRTRASGSLILTASARTAAGQSTVLSDAFRNAAVQEKPQSCRPAPRVAQPAPAATGIIGPESLGTLAAQHQSIGVTGLESLAGCRFRFFAEKSLRLESAPELPSKRLNRKVAGSILHQTLETWMQDQTENLLDVFEKVFVQFCEKENIQPGYEFETTRIETRRIAAKINAAVQWSAEKTETERDCSFELLGNSMPQSVTVKCRVDRIDHIGAGNCVIVDYKSGKVANVEKLVHSETSLQGPLYALAVRDKLHLNPVAMVFIAVQEGKLFGWGSIPGIKDELLPLPENWIDDARSRTETRLADFLSGHVQAEPATPEICEYCDFRSVCRIEEAEVKKSRPVKFETANPGVNSGN